MSRIAKITTIVLVCGITLSAAAYFLRDTAVAGVVMNKVNVYRLNQGLVGWWTFDGMDVSDKVYDRSGQGHHGYLQAGSHATNTMQVAGKIGQGLRFDGVGDEVVTNMIDMSGTGQLTYSFWLHEALGQSSDVNPVNLFWVSQSLFVASFNPSMASMGVCNPGETHIIARTNEGPNINCFTPPQATGWHHYAGVLDMTQPASGEIVGYYLDGVQQTPISQNESNNNPSPFPSDLVFVFQGWPNGILDDVRIYNRALSPSEIKLLYTSTAGSKMNTSKNVIPGSTLQTGLVGLWSFDGPDLTDKVYDRSGQGNHGYFIGGATSSAKVAGKVGQALRFDGVDDNVTLGDINFLDGATAFSVSIWVNQDSFPAADRTIISKHANSPKHFSFFTSEPGNGGVDDMELALTSSAGSIDCYAWTTTNVHEARQWEFWTVVFDGTQSGNANRVSMYKNGTPQTLTFGGTCPASTVSNGNVVRVGSDADLSPGFFWNGQLDDVRIYNRALSASEVKDLYTATAGAKVNTSQNNIPGSTLQQGLVGLWSFNGPDLNSRTNTAYDRSGQGNNGEMVNMSTSTSRVPGKVGQALQFDGVNDHVVLSSSLIGAGVYSICAWVNVDDFSGRLGIGVSYPFQFGIRNDGGIPGQTSVYVSNNDGVTFASSASFSSNTWHHVCATRNSGNTGTLYVDGTQSDTANQAAGTMSASVTYPFSIGSNYTFGLDFEGSLDEVRIYNRALTPQEVKLLYNLGR